MSKMNTGVWIYKISDIGNKFKKFN